MTYGDNAYGGVVTWPHMMRAPVSPTGTGAIFGGSIWDFDDGRNCVGLHGTTATGLPVTTTVELDCSDGTRLELTAVDVDVNPGVSVLADFSGTRVIPTDH